MLRKKFIALRARLSLSRSFDVGAVTLRWLLAAALCCGSVHAQVPRQINYQGYLTNPVGTPVNATVSMALKLYNVVTGGAALYTETQTVTVTNGVFNVRIGSLTALALPFDVPYYLGIKIDADPEMTPREQLVSVPYAIRAASAESLATTATVPGSQIIGALSSATLPAASLTGTITGSQLATGLTLGGTTAGTFSGPLTGNVIGNVTGNASGSAASFTGALAGDVTGTQGATAIAASTVTGKALTGFASGAGAISASDTVLTAINKLDGNAALKAPLASPAFTGTASAANLTVSNTLLAGSVGIPTASTSPVLPAKLNVVVNSPKATVATTRSLAITTNDAANPFALDVKVVGAAALTDRGIILQTTDWNSSDGGNLLLQPQGGNVAVGASSTGSKLAVAGVIESTSGGIKFPDSTVQLTAARKAQNVVVVAQSGGDFTTISAALASIVDNSAAIRYLVYVAPGTYNETVTMKPYVDIQGAGELATRITFGGNGASNTGTVRGASNAELRFLTVENTGGNQYAVAIYNAAAALRLTHVSANAFGGTQLSAGVLNEGTSSATIKDATASATGSVLNAGVYNSNSSVTINSSVVNASGGAVNWGIKNSWGVAGAYTVMVNNSKIIGSTNTINNDTFFNTLVGASQLSGGPVSTVVGTMTCAGVYDEAYVFSAGPACP